MRGFNASGFALQWNMGFSLAEEMDRTCGGPSYILKHVYFSI